MKNPTPRRSATALRLVLGITLAAAAAALSQTAMAGPGGWGGPQGEMHAGMGPGAALGHPRMVERMLDSVNATPEQRSQIRQLAEAAKKDMEGQREARRALREQSAQLFVQPTVDARAAEALRQQLLAQHDQASRRMTQLMLDVSRVLTPEQRKQIAERMAQRRSMMERHQRERQQMDRPQS
jgi:periplasmic protein CpxP/Spy